MRVILRQESTCRVEPGLEFPAPLFSFGSLPLRGQQLFFEVADLRIEANSGRGKYRKHSAALA